MSQDKVAAFHRSRVAFAVLDGKLVITKDDPRCHEDWLRIDFGVPKQEFETLIRGYVLGNRVQFFMGSDFHRVDNAAELDACLSLIQELLGSGDFASGKYDVFNGVVMGEPGEVWPPLECVTSLVVG